MLGSIATQTHSFTIEFLGQTSMHVLQGALLLLDHGNLLDELYCAFRAVLLADSASDASELADFFDILWLVMRWVNYRPDNIPSGSDRNIELG